MNTPLLLPFWDNRLPTARATMFCLPHAGGGASAYRDWVRASPLLDVQPVQLPGREQLLGMPGVGSMPELAALVGETIVGLPSQPFLLFGHSMGGAIAAEVTAWLERHGHPLPELLVISARPPVKHARPAPGESEDTWLLRRVLEMGGTPNGVLDNPEMRELFLDTIRTDMRLLEGYKPEFGQLSVPLLALGGTEDDVTHSHLARWQPHFSERIRIRMFTGGHFYLHEHRNSVLAAVEEAAHGPRPERKSSHGLRGGDQRPAHDRP